MAQVDLIILLIVTGLVVIAGLMTLRWSLRPPRRLPGSTSTDNPQADS